MKAAMPRTIGHRLAFGVLSVRRAVGVMAAKVNNSNKTHTKTLAQNGMTMTTARQARKANGTKKYEIHMPAPARASV